MAIFVGNLVAVFFDMEVNTRKKDDMLAGFDLTVFLKQ